MRERTVSLRPSEVTLLLTLLESARASGEYYGNREQYTERLDGLLRKLYAAAVAGE